MTKTEHYQLNQWDASDYVRREDFNEDNRKIEEALGTIPRIVFGTYTGDGAETRTIALGFTPKIIYLCNASGLVYVANNNYRTYYGGLFTVDAPIIDDYNHIVHQIVDHGFTVHKKEDSSNYLTMCYFSNENGLTYRYIAIG